MIGTGAEEKKLAKEIAKLEKRAQRGPVYKRLVNEGLGERIKARELTQAEVAKRLGVSHVAVSYAMAAIRSDALQRLFNGGVWCVGDHYSDAHVIAATEDVGGEVDAATREAWARAHDMERVGICAACRDERLLMLTEGGIGDDDLTTEDHVAYRTWQVEYGIGEGRDDVKADEFDAWCEAWMAEHGEFQVDRHSRIELAQRLKWMQSYNTMRNEVVAHG